MIENINTDIIKHKNTWNKKQYNSIYIYIKLQILWSLFIHIIKIQYLLLINKSLLLFIFKK